MTILTLPPSEIRYTQDSIGNVFGRCTSHPYHQIGETLDDLLLGRCSVYSIPRISVLKQDNNYFTADNRRLWVFRQAEELGHVETIPVYDGAYINPMKWTTVNNGLSLYVRGNPGGSHWKTLSPKPKERREIISDFTEVGRKALSAKITGSLEKYDSVGVFLVNEPEESDEVHGEFSKVNVDTQNIDDGDKIDEECSDMFKLETTDKSNHSNSTSNLATLSGIDNKAYVNVNDNGEIELQSTTPRPIPVAEIEIIDESESLDDVTTQSESVHPRKEHDITPGYTSTGEAINLQELKNPSSSSQNMEIFSIQKENYNSVVVPVEENSVDDNNSNSVNVRNKTPCDVTNNTNMNCKNVLSKLLCNKLTILLIIIIIVVIITIALLVYLLDSNMKCIINI